MEVRQTDIDEIIHLEKRALERWCRAYGDSEDVHRWNCTEVYRRDPEGWRIVQTHWSFTGRVATAP